MKKIILPLMIFLNILSSYIKDAQKDYIRYSNDIALAPLKRTYLFLTLFSYAFANSYYKICNVYKYFNTVK